MEYKVMLETFEGPLDLLLYLIEKAQIDIYEIPINEITDQYLDYIKKMGELDLEITSDFLVMAATLLEIKSKMLLPSTKEDVNLKQLEIEEADPRTELVNKLIEYKKYKNVAIRLKDLEEIQKKIFYKPKEDFALYSSKEEKLEDMNIEQLAQAYKKLFRKRTKNRTFIITKIQNEEYTLKECINKIKNILKLKKRIKFSQLFKGKPNRREIVSTFLSLLELVKNKYICAYQRNNFDDILISKLDEEGDCTNG